MILRNTWVCVCVLFLFIYFFFLNILRLLGQSLYEIYVADFPYVHGTSNLGMNPNCLYAGPGETAWLFVRVECL